MPRCLAYGRGCAPPVSNDGKRPHPQPLPEREGSKKGSLCSPLSRRGAGGEVFENSIFSKAQTCLVICSEFSLQRQIKGTSVGGDDAGAGVAFGAARKIAVAGQIVEAAFNGQELVAVRGGKIHDVVARQRR